MCSTPEGIGAEIGSNYVKLVEDCANGCSTPEGIGAEIGIHARVELREQPLVLNARGHRSGDRVTDRESLGRIGLVCSTPEGIGAEIGAAIMGGIPMTDIVCSTPEGIGAEIGPQFRSATSIFGVVLNARGHRSGDRMPALTRALRTGWCSTPEGIGAEIGPALLGRRPRDRPRCAQRPRASERRSAGRRSASDRSASPSCSTPEGIGAEIGVPPLVEHQNHDRI